MIDIGFSTSYERHTYEPVVGDKILDDQALARIVHAVVPDYVQRNPPDDDGEWCVPLGNDALPYVACGIGIRSKNTAHYVTRLVRGRVGLYLRREFALPPESCSVWVQGWDRFVQERKELEDETPEPILETMVTHVVTGISVRNSIASGRQRRPQDFITSLGRVIAYEHMANERMKARTDILKLSREAELVEEYWTRFAEVSD